MGVDAPSLKALHEIYEHWGRGDWSPHFAFYGDDFEWGWSPEFPEVAGVHRDTETPNSRLRTWLSPWALWACEAVDYLTSGDQVVVLCRYRGHGKGSGATVDVDGAHVWRIAGGRARRLEIFASRAAALEAAGLE